MDSLQERLRREANSPPDLASGFQEIDTELLTEAADALDAAEARIAELEARVAHLESPFAKFTRPWL